MNKMRDINLSMVIYFSGLTLMGMIPLIALILMELNLI